MDEREGRMTWDGHETWYRVVGDVESDGGRTPVVICHGGPGASHDYCEPIAELSRFGRGCVLYDQIGCGKSEHLPDAPAEFWTPQLFKDELRAVDAPSRYRGPLRRRRPVVGRDARHGARARSSGRPAGHRRGGLACEHDAVGLGGQPPQRVPAARRPVGAGEARGGRDDRRSRVRDSRQGLLRSPPLPGAVAGLRAAQLRSDRRRPDRVPHDERAERVPRGRIVEGVGHHGSPR